MQEKEPVRNKELAKLMKEYCPDYSGYEYIDFLKIFAEVIEQLIAQGETVRILNLGDFKPRYNSSKDYVIGDRKYTASASKTLQFTASHRLQERLKKGYREGGHDVSSTSN